jgi:hypothetical protein
MPLNAESVISKLNISLRTPLGSRPSSRSSIFTPKAPKTATELQNQASALKALLK